MDEKNAKNEKICDEERDRQIMELKTLHHLAAMNRVLSLCKDRIAVLNEKKLQGTLSEREMGAYELLEEISEALGPVRYGGII